jgi:hypothetical protein
VHGVRAGDVRPRGLRLGSPQCAQATKVHGRGQEPETPALAENRSAARTTQRQARPVHAALPERQTKTVGEAALLGVAEIKGHAV